MKMRRPGPGFGQWGLGVLMLSALVAAVAALRSGLDSNGLPRTEFRVRGVPASFRTIARNETVIVEFSDEIAPDSPIEALVTLRTPKGDTLGFRAEVSGSLVLLYPPNDAGWERTGAMDLEIARGQVASIRSRDGRPLAESHRAELLVGESYTDFGAPFHLVEGPPPNVFQVGRGNVFSYRFSLPIEPSSLAVQNRAITVQGIVGRSQPPTTWLGQDGHTLFVRPFGAIDQGGFAPGREHRISLKAGGLQSVTGRRLEAPVVTTFWTSKDERDFESHLDFSFRLADLDPRENPGLSRDRTFAYPQLAPVQTIELNGNPVYESGFEVPTPWSTRAARLQILIPGSELGRDPGLVTGFSFLAGESSQDELLFPRVRIKIGYAAVSTELGLGPVFDRNFAFEIDGDSRDLPVDTVTRGSRRGEFMITGAERYRWITVHLERPFSYTGGSRDLILEISNDKGAVATDDAGTLSSPRHLLWAAERRSRPGMAARALFAEGENGPPAEGTPQSLAYSLRLQVERFVDQITPWESTDIEDPIFFLVRSADYLDAEGTENLDFRFEFQGWRDNQTTPWSSRLETLAGCRKIRAKVRFLPRPGLARERRTEVRRLRIRYQDTP